MGGGTGPSGYWPGPWSGEDGGPERRQVPGPVGSPVPGPVLRTGSTLAVTARQAPLATMVVTRDPGEVYLLRHTAGDDAVSFVERIDPVTLEPLGRSADLPGGPTWPGSIAAHADGSLHVVFGNHAHRLDAGLRLTASATLPEHRPYNGFVIMPDGHLVTKAFAGSRPGTPVPAGERQPCELVALDPVDLAVVDRCVLDEPSIARLSAQGDEVFVVGDTSLIRVRWDGRFHPDRDPPAPYRTLAGQTYGWDCVLALGAAWFLDNGDGSERYSGTLRGHGLSSAPLHLVRVDLGTGSVTMAEVGGGAGGLVANPPLVDLTRSIAVGFDSGNGLMTAFSVGSDGALAVRWRRRQDHGSHMALMPASGVVFTGDYDAGRGADQLVAIDIGSGEELARTDTGSPVQSVLFPAVGFDRDLYLCSFSTVTRVTVGPGG